MTTRIVITITVVAVLTVACTNAQDGLPAWPERPALQFKLVDKPLLRKGTPDVGPLPRYAACLAFRSAIRRDIDLSRPVSLPGRRDERAELASRLLRTPPGKQLSQGQQQLLERSSWCTRYGGERPWRGSLEWFPRDTTQYVLDAIGEQDAHLMAEAFLAVFDDEARGRFEGESQELAKYLAEVEQLRAELPPLETQHERRAARLAAVDKKTHYTSMEEAEKDYRQLTVALRAVDIEMAGIHAKVAAIERLKTSDRAQHPEAKLALDRLMLEQDVELAGALARKSALESHRALAVEFQEAQVALDELVQQLSKKRKRLQRVEGQVQRLFGLLRNPSDDLRPRLIVDNTVVVQRIEYTDE